MLKIYAQHPNAGQNIQRHSTWKQDFTGELGFVVEVEDIRPILPGGGEPSPLRGEICAQCEDTPFLDFEDASEATPELVPKLIGDIEVDPKP